MTLRLELFVDDVQQSLHFYREVLGFEVLSGAENATYQSLRYGNSRIAIQDVRSLAPDHPLAQRGKRGLGVEMVLEVADVTASHQWAQAQWAQVTELQHQPWGLTDFRVIDPDGYYWRITDSRTTLF